MSTIFRKIRLSRLTKVDRAFLLFKLVIAITLFVPLMQSPTFRASVTGVTLVAWIAVSVAGLVISAFGLLLGAQGPNTRQIGFRWELTGLWLLMCSPLAFSAVHIGLMVTPGGKASAVAIFFPMIVAAAINARRVMVKEATKTVLYRFPGEKLDD